MVTATKKETTSMIIREVPRKLRDAFKAACAKRGVSMNHRLLELIEKNCDESGK